MPLTVLRVPLSPNCQTDEARPPARRLCSHPLFRPLRQGGPLACACAALGLLSGACTPEIYHTRADRETYGALYQKNRAIDNVEDEDVDITAPEPIDLAAFPRNERTSDFLGAEARDERGAILLKLDDALETGVTHGREYLSEKERVYLSALDLTLARHRLAPIFNAGGDLGWATDSRGAAVREGVSGLVSTNTFARTSGTGFNWLLATGARVSSDFTRDFLRFTTGNRSVNRSALAVSVVQPLLQGGGATVTMEALTQEERNLLYALRNFADFRRSFLVELVSDYYSVLRARDQVQNNFLAYQGFLSNVEREEALADEDRRTQTELGLLRQASLQSESRWIDSIRNYETRLDNFKLKLGVPVEENFVLDDGELKRLLIEDPDVTREEAVEIALVTRPDLATARDRVEDAERRIKVTRNGLLPGADISLDYNTLSDPGDTTPGINWNRRRWDGSIDLDLPLDRKAQRNNYRAAHLLLERAKRAEDQAQDRARLAIYDAWRALEQAKKNFEVAEQQVALAMRRLEEQSLLAELGRGEARDLIDVQNDLVNARNQRTSTMVDHTLARLRLWRDMGILYVNRDGSWAVKLESESP